MESLHYGEMLGGYYINSGFYWGSTTGIYCDILGRVCSRLAAGRRFCRVQGRYAYPAGAYFCSCKSRQNTLGAVPQDPLAAKLRLDTDWAFQLPLKSRSAQRRRYALKVPAAHLFWILLRPN